VGKSVLPIVKFCAAVELVGVVVVVCCCCLLFVDSYSHWFLLLAGVYVDIPENFNLRLCV
jgi:hypothetical protein